MNKLRAWFKAPQPEPEYKHLKRLRDMEVVTTEWIGQLVTNQTYLVRKLDELEMEIRDLKRHHS